MYLMQLIEYHREFRCGCSGAAEHNVIASLAKAEGISYQDAARRVEMAVMLRDVYRVKCRC